MKIQIIKSNFYLRKFWGINLRSIHYVVSKYSGIVMKKGKKAEEVFYKIPAIVSYNCKSYGKEVEIVIKGEECVEVSD